MSRFQAAANVERNSAPPDVEQSKDAFEILFHSHYEQLCRYAWRQGVPTDVAEDLVQDVFLGLWSDRQQLGKITSLTAYLYGATRHAVLNHARRKRVVRKTLDRAQSRNEPLGFGTPAVLPDRAHDQREFESTVTRAVRSLPHRCRESFLLHRDGDLTYAEVGQLMGVSPKTVKTQIGRALAVLRNALSAKGLL